MALTARERVRQTVKRQVAESHVEQELQATLDLHQQSFAYFLIVFVEDQFVEPFLQSDDRHLNKVGDASSANLHVISLGLQACAVTGGTVGLSPVTAQHHAVLYLVLVFLKHLEERVDTWAFLLPAVRRQTVPQPVLLRLCQVHIGLEDREVVLHSVTTEPFLPLFHLLTMPADDAAVIDGEGRIGNDQFLVDADDATEALTLRTGPHRGVEREHLIVWFLEGHAVGLIFHGEVIEDV